MIADKFPQYREHIAAGLVGDGSECFGFDDDLSMDHDWGPAFCLWLTVQDYKAIGLSLQNEINKLSGEYAGITRQTSSWGKGRTGVFETGRFYERFIGFNHVPETMEEWRIIPEENLAAATNGMIFTDPPGEFTAFRNKLKEYYPEDIRLKKIASRCMAIAQSGQYNYTRCIKRREFVAAHYAEAQFFNSAISMIFLLNKRYKPFYKWMHRSLKELLVLGSLLYPLFSDIAIPSPDLSESLYKKKSRLIEEICGHIIQELKRQNLSDSGSDFLLDHGPAVQSKIRESSIRNLDVWID
ncbi:MAG: DUF4037 domain-containing protein [Spirochaetes bacterium]|nr:DUF4037 domain-containing protein [Spirochaetota bacterium]